MPKIDIPGRYSVAAVECSLGESQSGTPFIQLSFETDDKNYITGWLYLSEKAIDRTFKVLEDAFNFSGNFEVIEAELQGKQCSIVCEEEDDHQGNPRMRVKWINPARAKPKAVQNEMDFRKALTSKFARQSQAPAQPELTGVSSTKDNLDEVPF